MKWEEFRIELREVERRMKNEEKEKKNDEERKD